MLAPDAIEDARRSEAATLLGTRPEAATLLATEEAQREMVSHSLVKEDGRVATVAIVSASEAVVWASDTADAASESPNGGVTAPACSWPTGREGTEHAGAEAGTGRRTP
jgi:hypothetical protein